MDSDVEVGADRSDGGMSSLGAAGCVIFVIRGASILRDSGYDSTKKVINRYRYINAMRPKTWIAQRWDEQRNDAFFGSGALSNGATLQTQLNATAWEAPF